MVDRVAVGRVVGVFGIKGWLKVKSETEPAENIINYSPWYLKTPHGLKVLEVDDYAFRPQGLVVHFKGFDDRDQSLALGKAVVEIEKDQLPELESDDYYWHQLIGLQVLSQFDGQEAAPVLLGEVKSLMETGANDVLVVAPCEGSLDAKERLVPYVPGQFVVEVSLERKQILVDWDPDF